MATERPRFTITVSDEMLEDIDNFRYENRYPTRTMAVNELMRLGIETLKKKSEKKTLENFIPATTSISTLDKNNYDSNELTEEEHKKAKEEAKKLLEGSIPIVSIAAFGGDGVESTVLTEEQHKKAREEAKKLLERE